MGLSFSVISHVQRPVHRTWHMEIVNKILHLWVNKVMSHRGEASMKHDRKVFVIFVPSLPHLTILLISLITSQISYPPTNQLFMQQNSLLTKMLKILEI